MAMPPGFPSAAPAGPSSGGPSARAGGERRLLLLAGTVAFGVLFGLFAAVAFAAWAAGLLGAVGGLVVGLLLAWALPLFLSVRAALALKKKKPASVLLRRLVALFLVGLVQVTVFLAGFVSLGQGAATTSGELAAAGLPLLRGVPGLGPWLQETAREGHALVDAGTPPGTPPDAPGTTPPGPDAGPDAGPGAGAGVVDAVVQAGLEPRAGGRPVGTVAVGAQTTEGDIVVVVWQVAFGGAVAPRVVDLAALASLGTPTRVEASQDGHVVAVLGGAHVVVAAPAGPAAEDKALGRGAKVGELELQRVRDVAVGPGGALLLAVDAFDDAAKAPLQALVARPAGGAAFVVRKAGDVVDAVSAAAAKKGEKPTVAHGWSIKRGDGSGAVVVEEELLEGGDDVGTKLTGAQWTMNPRRLLAGQLDNARALAEIARTGADPSGVEGVSLQGFGDAVQSPDGRVFFDANYVEDGPRGWVFSARAGGGAFALAPELVGKPEAPFAERAPRVRHLALDADGATFAFVNRDGAVVTGPVARPADAKPGVLRADGVRGDGGKAGAVASVGTVRLAGDWLVAGVELLADGGARNEAVVVVGKKDLVANKGLVLLEVGGPLPSPPSPVSPPSPGAVDAGVPASPPAGARRVKSIFFDEGHDEPLWQPG